MSERLLSRISTVRVIFFGSEHSNRVYLLVKFLHWIWIIVVVKLFHWMELYSDLIGLKIQWFKITLYPNMKATSISKTIKRKQNRKSMSHGMVNTVDNVNVSVSDHALILELHDKLDIALQMVQDILETEKSQ